MQGLKAAQKLHDAKRLQEAAQAYRAFLAAPLVGDLTGASIPGGHIQLGACLRVADAKASLSVGAAMLKKQVEAGEPGAAEAYFNARAMIGDVCRDQRDWDGAIGEYSAAREGLSALINISLTEHKTKRLAKMGSALGNVHEEKGNALYNALMRDAKANGGRMCPGDPRLEGAEIEYRKAVEFSPDNHQFRHNLSGCLRTMRKADEAIVQLRHAIRLGSGATSFVNLGLLLAARASKRNIGAAVVPERCLVEPLKLLRTAKRKFAARGDRSWVEKCSGLITRVKAGTYRPQ
jgi:tetratricopeptide (TPR) repeat protein